MAKVSVRKETGKLVIDFTYRGVRCREQTALGDTPANRKRVEAVLKRLREAIAAGAFVYGEFFPGSALASRFASAPVVHAGTDTGASIPQLASPAAAVPKPASPNFREFVTTWLAEHQIEWRRSHLKVLKSTLDAHLLPAFGDKPVGEITKSDILAFRAKLADKPGRTGDKLSSKRINNILGVLRQIMADAADRHGFISPSANVRPLKVRKSDVQPFSLDQVQQILAVVRPDYRDYFTVRFFTGMRTGEAHGLKWKYVDFERRLILVRETFVLGEDEYTKTDSSQRDIQMSQPVYEALKRQHAATGKLSEYVFCNREGHPLDNKNFSERVWYPLLRHLELAPRRPYQMRHTAATLWLASGESPQWIANQLGHANSQMLFTVYGHFVPNMTRRDGSAIDRLLATRFASGSAVAEAANEAGHQAQPPPASWRRVA
ncbi:site-specific integrase [Rubrivivax benzoatilyticus]|uniref:Site-specific integrase n=1 Tax=Rubrivivax benzoatilyticus TaxID=316997 RepID=A0ABX0I0A1_9BURK|nr:site-specific integrase [Rubrivivax benzoatilyticus]NHK99514.1 site-specific integrase [Rubrivivax benzoatilyticus]NHL25388.1 site-specific integrase [Rubrivivax benzoatilyticus]